MIVYCGQLGLLLNFHTSLKYCVQCRTRAHDDVILLQKGAMKMMSPCTLGKVSIDYSQTMLRVGFDQLIVSRECIREHLIEPVHRYVCT